MKTVEEINEKIRDIGEEIDSGTYMVIEEKKLRSWILALRWVLGEITVSTEQSAEKK